MMWIGCDLDGTLAKNGSTKTIGEPVESVADIVRVLLDCGYCVKIFTARVSSKVDELTRAYQTRMINAYCMTLFGRQLEVTAEKDYEMLFFLDDRAIEVIPDKGLSNIGMIR